MQKEIRIGSCDAVRNVSKPSLQRINTYIIQFIYNEGNGWAFVNATSPKQAQLVFTNQTRYYGAKVTAIKETKYYGDNIQLVFEGAVTTIPAYVGDDSMSVNFNILDYVPDGDKYKKFEDYLKATIENIVGSVDVNLDNYYTKDEIDKLLHDIVTLQGDEGGQGSNDGGGNDEETLVEANSIVYKDNTNKDVENVQQALDLIFANLTSIMGKGSLETAQDVAENANVFFAWLLEFTITSNGQSIDCKKVIWHVPGTGINNDYGYFIDALGAIIS